MVAAMKHIALNFAMLEKFEGMDFRRWPKKMHFLLSSMSVVYVLTTSMPEDDGDNPSVEQVRRRAKWNNDDYVCRVVNMMEYNNSSRYNDNKGKCKHRDTKADPNKKPKIYYVTYVSKAYFVQDNDVAWLVDSGATVHVCKDKCWFKTYESLNDGSVLHMGNESTALVHGRGCVDLRLNIGSAFMSTSKLNDSILWHVRLGHVHFKMMQDMSKDGDLYDLHATPSLRNKNYFVTFIDGASRFCYVSLLHTKDEALYKFKVFNTKVELQQRSLIKRFRTDSGGGYMDTLYFQSVVAINSIIESRDAIFDEHSFSSVPRPSQRSLKDGNEDSGGSVVSKRVTDDVDDLKTFNEAIKSQDITFWKEAINDEMDSIMGNNTWVLTDLPQGCRPLGCKWIFKRKLKTVDCYGIYSQSDYPSDGCEDSFFEWGTRIGGLYEPTSGFIMHGNKNKVCKLIKSLKIDGSGKGVIICLYVDDMLIFGTDQAQVDLTKEFLSSRFSLKDMREANVIFGIRIKHESNSIIISQSHYIEKVLKKFNYSNCTSVSTLLDTCEKLMPNKGPAVSKLEYSMVIGCLMYAMTYTRPDIAFVVAPISICCDNDGTLAKAYSQMYNGKSRHLGVRHSMIRELITNGVVSIEFVRSQQNLADHLTKGLARDLIIKSAEWMRLKSN
nr:zinc finger, CCHC-type [Tanacetum cinerariifolium]